MPPLTVTVPDPTSLNVGEPPYCPRGSWTPVVPALVSRPSLVKTPPAALGILDVGAVLGEGEAMRAGLVVEDARAVDVQVVGEAVGGIVLELGRAEVVQGAAEVIGVEEVALPVPPMVSEPSASVVPVPVSVPFVQVI